MTNCKAVPGEACLLQHRMVRADLLIADAKKKEWKGERKIKMWKLKNENTRKKFENVFSERMMLGDGSWKQLEVNITEAGIEVCGETSGKRGRERETWWWNEEVQHKIKEKKTAYKLWQRSRNAEDKAIYKLKCKEARMAVAIAKQEAWENFGRDLTTERGRHKMFKLAKQMKKDKKDIQGTNFIKDDDGVIKIEEDEVAERWRTYFHQLLNDENESAFEEAEVVEGPIMDITKEEVERALKGMKNGKATGPSGVSSDLMKYAGRTGIDAILKVFRGIVQKDRVPIEWGESLTVPLYKAKGDALQCKNHRGLRLLEHGMKIWERILNERLRHYIHISDNQFGFMGGKSTTDAIFIIRQLQERYGEKKKKLYHVFVDLEKAFDKVPRAAICWALRRQRVPESLIRLVMSLYTDSRSRVKVAGVTSKSFEINVGVHQGSALSPLLFIVVLEEATRRDGGGDPWELLYADDLVLTAESMEEVEVMFREWKQMMEGRGLKVNMEKTKLMVTGKKIDEEVQRGRYPCGVCGLGVGRNSILCVVCNKWCHARCSRLKNLSRIVGFRCSVCTEKRGEVRKRPKEEVMEVEGEVVEEVKQFRYLGDVLDCEGGVERAVRARVAAAWMKWREISGLLTNKSIPLNHRGKVYESCIRSVLLYGGETWALTERIKDVILSCDRRMLRYMAGVIWSDMVRSSEVAERCGLREISVVLQARRLRWLGHVERRDEGEALGRIKNLVVPGRRPPGRPKNTWRKNMEDEMRSLNVVREDAHNRDEWRAIIARLTS